MAQYSNREELLGALENELGNISGGKLKPSTDEKDAAIRDALDELNRLKPRAQVYEEAGDASTKRWILSTTITGPPAWADEDSELSDVMRVTNAGDDDEEEYPYGDDDWEVRLSSAGAKVLFVDTAVPTGDNLRLIWTKPHTLKDFDGSTVTTTIPLRDKQVLLLLAASNTASIIARKASSLEDHTMGIDQVDYSSFDRRWSKRSTELRKMAIERLTPSEISAGAAGTSAEWQTTGRLHGTRVSH